MQINKKNVTLSLIMMIMQSPLVWLARVRHRRGYGVHSPFAFDFITNVVYNRERYYAYEQIDKGLRWWQKARVRSVRRLLFRLANFHQPRTIGIMCCDKALLEACRCAVRGVEVLDLHKADAVDMIVADRADELLLRCVRDGTMMVLLNLRQNREFWKRVKADEGITLTFDMYDIGVALAKRVLNKQDYVVNW